MRPTNHPGHIIARDTDPADGNEEVLSELPFSLEEVNELLYGEDRSADERIERLRELAGHLRQLDAGDLADGDPRSLLTEVEGAISTLETKQGFAGEPGALDDDPLNHRETLAPDSDELEEIEKDDDESVEDDIGRH